MIVKAKVDIIEPANECHPMLLLAKKGDTLEVVDETALYEIPVINHKLSGGEFYVNISEIVLIKEETK